jgi:hypothetical protein
MKKRHTPEQIIQKLRQTEADLAAGLTIAQACQKLAVRGRLETGLPPRPGGSLSSRHERTEALPE